MISLEDLKLKIAEMEAREGIEGYEKCISGKILQERVARSSTLTHLDYAKTLASGSPVGAEIDRYPGTGGPKYNNPWLGGPDAGFFQASVDDADSDPSNGYDYLIATARPLPGGSYHFYDYIQNYKDMECNEKYTDFYGVWTVSVAFPAGTVHEAFFDPVAVGTGAGADTTNGALKPTSFTVGGAAAGLAGLKWEGSTVTLTLSPYAALTGQAIDFIALDGTVALTLLADAATVDSAAGILSWTVATQPWSAGDQLMLRIRETGSVPIPPPTLHTTPPPTPPPTLEPTRAPTPTPKPTITPVPGVAAAMASLAPEPAVIAWAQRGPSPCRSIRRSWASGCSSTPQQTAATCR